MAIGDFFRPKYKHSKSEVRAAAVAAMDKDDIDLLIEVANQDRDSAIRKTAIKKISDPETLAEIASAQDDSKLRDYTNSLAVDIWVSKAVNSDDEEIAQASFLRAIEHGGARAIAEIAGESQHASIRSEALLKIHDAKALGQVVRRSQRMEEWQSALERIDDVTVLRSIAIDESRKQVAFAALEYIDDPAILDEISAKAKAKPVRAKAKRAKAALVKAKPAVSKISDEEKQASAERSQLVRTLEKLVGGDEWIESRVIVDDSAARWEELGDGNNAKLLNRFDKALARYNKNHAQYGLAAQEAARRLEDEQRREQARAAARVAAEEKRLEQEQSAPADNQSEGSGEEAAAAAGEETPVVTQSQSTEKQDREADRRLDNQDDLERLCETLEELLESKEIRGLDRTLKEVDKAKRKIGGLPKNVEEELQARYAESRKKAVIYLGDLREADDWKRWAAVPKMEALVAKSKALLADEENKKVGESLKQLQRAWRELGPAPREKGDELWKVFKSTCDEVYEKVKAQREVREQEQNENLVKKEALCKRAEELQSSTDWAETSAAFKEMQTEWKSIGPVPRRKSDNQWKRFRTACDAFFEARAPHLEDRFAEEAENLEAKEALIKEVTALAEADGDIGEQIEQVRVMQRRWRDIGNVSHKDFANLNDNYKAACDKVYGKREAASAAEKEAIREVVSGLEKQIVECADAGWDSDAADIAKTVLEIRSTYLGLSSDIEGYESLGAKVNTLIRSQLESEPAAYAGSVLDPIRSVAAREAILVRAEEMAPEEAQEDVGKSPEEMAETLRAALADRALGGVLSKTSGRSPQEVVEALRLEWAEIPPVPGAAGTNLQQQFEAICQRLLAAATETKMS